MSKQNRNSLTDTENKLRVAIFFLGGWWGRVVVMRLRRRGWQRRAHSGSGHVRGTPKALVSVNGGWGCRVKAA